MITELIWSLPFIKHKTFPLMEDDNFDQCSDMFRYGPGTSSSIYMAFLHPGRIGVQDRGPHKIERSCLSSLPCALSEFLFSFMNTCMRGHSCGEHVALVWMYPNAIDAVRLMACTLAFGDLSCGEYVALVWMYP